MIFAYLLKWIGQYIEQAVHTNFAEVCCNISMKNVIKFFESVKPLNVS